MVYQTSSQKDPRVDFDMYTQIVIFWKQKSDLDLHGKR